MTGEDERKIEGPVVVNHMHGIEAFCNETPIPSRTPLGRSAE